ncbi:MAG: hypothetical protein V1800_05330 [Candidatus Latescibacterota bacterium]
MKYREGVRRVMVVLSVASAAFWFVYWMRFYASHPFHGESAWSLSMGVLLWIFGAPLVLWVLYYLILWIIAGFRGEEKGDGVPTE